MITNISSSDIILSSTSYLHDPNYIPAQYVLIFIAIGFLCWCLLSYNKELEILFSLVSILSFGAAAWFAAYMTVESATIIVKDGVATSVYSQVVTPQPGLQIIMIVCFLFSIIITIYLLFLRDADKKMDASSVRGKV